MHEPTAAPVAATPAPKVAPVKLLDLIHVPNSRNRLEVGDVVDSFLIAGTREEPHVCGIHGAPWPKTKNVKLKIVEGIARVGHYRCTVA